MKIVEYDDEHYAILVKKRVLQNTGFGPGEDVYVVVLENGLLGVIKKSSFKMHLKKAVKQGIQGSGPDSSPVKKEDIVSRDEESVLNKILSHKFEDRTPSNILGQLTDSEKNILKSLVNKGILSVYKKGRYKGKGVYVISKEVYNILNPLKPRQDNVSRSVDERANASRRGHENKPEGLVKRLESDGFIIIKSDDTARQVSQMLHDKVKKGFIIGARGFDSNYYIFTKQYYDKLYALISDYFDNNKRAKLPELANSIGVDESACKGILAILLGKGDIIEKTRNTYELV